MMARRRGRASVGGSRDCGGGGGKVPTKTETGVGGGNGFVAAGKIGAS